VNIFKGPANSGSFCPGGLAFATFLVNATPTPPPTAATPGMLKKLSTNIVSAFLAI
jgi:hypothetical protein